MPAQVQLPVSASTVPWPKQVVPSLYSHTVPTHESAHMQLPFVKVPWLLHEPGRSAAMALAAAAADAHAGALANSTF